MCSCRGCGNQRGYEGKTMQEHRAERSVDLIGPSIGSTSTSVIMAAGPFLAALESAGVTEKLRIMITPEDAARLATSIGVQAKPKSRDDGLQELQVGQLVFVTKA